MEEARACLHALVKEMGLDSLVVEGDHSRLRRKQVDDAFVDLFVKNILEVIESFKFVSWSYVMRGGNMVSHEYTHWQPISFESTVWGNDVLEAIANRVSDDMYACINSTLI